MVLHERTGFPIIRKSDDIFTTMNQIQNMIRERAFDIYSNRDSTEGNAMSDWLTAESEVSIGIGLSLDEDENQVIIEGDVTGFLPEEIEVKAKDGVFEIGGMHTEDSSSKNKNKGVAKTISKQMSFFRSFTLPDSVDTRKMEVTLKKGKFTAKIPKTSH